MNELMYDAEGPVLHSVFWVGFGYLTVTNPQFGDDE